MHFFNRPVTKRRLAPDKALCLRRMLKDKILRIWLLLLVLTLSSALIAETVNPTVWTTALVCFVVIVKGHWVIDHFMGLKNQYTLARQIMNAYLVGITMVVGLLIANYHLTRSVAF